MSITYAIMVPHPPLIMKEVGRGEERLIQDTIDAYRVAMTRLAATLPETVVISSPHALLYGDYFHVSPGERARGDMGQFRAAQVAFDVRYDDALVSYIEGIAGERDFPAGTFGDRMPELDHGTMVPLYFLREELPDVKIVRVGLSGLSYDDHYRMGQIIAEAAERLNRRVAFIASGDLSHKQKDDGPYGFVPEGPVYDEELMDVMGAGRFDLLFDFDEAFCDKAAECGHRSFLMMAGALDGISVKAETLSHEATFGVGYGVATFEPLGKDDNRRFLRKRLGEKESAMEERKYSESAWVRLARAVIDLYVKDGAFAEYGRTKDNQKLVVGTRLGKSDERILERISLSEEENAELFQKTAGAFVSLHKDGNLRGCIGTFLPTTSCVADEIAQNAISACSRDPRFLPVRADELSSLDISVDVLDEPEVIDSPRELNVKEYGVIVSSKDGTRRGLLLPDLEGVDTVDFQIAIARQKGGIGEDEPVNLERFRVVRHH